MKAKITVLLLLSMLSSPVMRANNTTAPTAKLHDMRIDYGVTVNDRLGMLMHISFTVWDAQGQDICLSAYFKHDNGDPDAYIRHEDRKDVYHATGGYLSVAKFLTPTYESSRYDDVQLFFPYDEFGLEPGNYDLAIDVQLLYKNPADGGTFAWLKQYYIEFTQPDKSRSSSTIAPSVKIRALPATGPRATFDSMWVDYNVKENNELGMRLHFKFVALDMKDVEGLVAVYFLYNDEKGGTLKDKNGDYTSNSGNVAVYGSIKPGYDKAYYDDFVLFMPYDELELGSGKYQLEMDAKLIYKEGGLISNFRYYAFEYSN